MKVPIRLLPLVAGLALLAGCNARADTQGAFANVDKSEVLAERDSEGHWKIATGKEREVALRCLEKLAEPVIMTKIPWLSGGKCLFYEVRHQPVIDACDGEFNRWIPDAGTR